MKEHCENPLCENAAFKEVAVSIEEPGDQVRTLCATCEEAYTWGLQHGSMTAGLDRLNGFLRKGGFIVLAMNREDPSPDAPFEAWAYEGPLDFNEATPIVFGLGAGCRSALDALNSLLAADNARHGELNQRTS